MEKYWGALVVQWGWHLWWQWVGHWWWHWGCTLWCTLWCKKSNYQTKINKTAQALPKPSQFVNFFRSLYAVSKNRSPHSMSWFKALTQNKIIVIFNQFQKNYCCNLIFFWLGEGAPGAEIEVGTDLGGRGAPWQKTAKNYDFQKIVFDIIHVGHLKVNKNCTLCKNAGICVGLVGGTKQIWSREINNERKKWRLKIGE